MAVNLISEFAMPLLDHFHPPLSRTHPWRAFHGAWAAAMARLLNAGVLPPGYYAIPFLDHDGPVEIDVAAVREFETTGTDVDSPGPQPWNPGEPQRSVAVEWPTLDNVRVEILSDDGDPQMAAAIELVSPRNKDRPKSREAFAAKCAEHLRRGCGVVVVDVVTTRHANLQADLMAAVGAEQVAEPSEGLLAVSYRAVCRDDTGQLQSWCAVPKVGQPLPTVPLWLGGELAVPLDLEASHATACEDLRIRRAG